MYNMIRYDMIRYNRHLVKFRFAKSKTKVGNMFVHSRTIITIGHTLNRPWKCVFILFTNYRFGNSNEKFPSINFPVCTDFLMSTEQAYFRYHKTQDIQLLWEGCKQQQRQMTQITQTDR